MRRPRLPVEFAMFAAGTGLITLFGGLGAAALVRYGEGGIIPGWSWGVAAIGLGLLVATTAAYFLRIIQFVRQRGVEYDSFFYNLPLEGEDHPKDANEVFEGFADQRPWVYAVVLTLVTLLKIFWHDAHLRRFMNADLGSIASGAESWSVSDVLILGCGTVVLVFMVGMLLRRIWAMQRGSPGRQKPE